MDRPGEGRGRVNPDPRSLVWRFWRFGGLLVQGVYTPRDQRPRRMCPSLVQCFIADGILYCLWNASIACGMFFLLLEYFIACASSCDFSERSLSFFDSH